jgi:glycosyltransferase involved in cell wall biosynthesis
MVPVHSLNKQEFKKVLIIDEQFPYHGGSRTEKFVKYLPQSEWKSIILTNSENKQNYLIKDSQEPSNHNGFTLYRTSSIPNFFVLKKFNLERFAGILNGLFFIPDINVAWLPFAIIKGAQIIEKEKPEIIYSSSPREGVHLIAYFLKKKSGLPWVADFRDLWTLYKGRYKPLTIFHDAINTYIEKKIYRKWSDVVIANTPENKEIICKNFKARYEKIHVITNGYDPDDAEIGSKKNIKSQHFKVGFIGDLEKPALCYDSFLKAFASATQRRKNFKLMIWTKNPGRLMRLIKKYNAVNNSIEFMPYVPHKQCLRELQRVDILLVLLGKKYPHVVPQKLYNYLGLQIPILGIVPEYSRAAKIIRTSRCGFIVSPDDPSRITDNLIQLNNKWLNGNLKIEADQEILFKYRRDILAKKLARIFNATSRNEERSIPSKE